MKAVVIALFATATALTVDSADAASFNCAKAKSKIEMAICADPELSKMGEILSISYAKALKSHPLPESISKANRLAGQQRRV